VKGGKPNRKPYLLPYVLRNPYRNLKSENSPMMLPRNLNEIVRSWIRPLDTCNIRGANTQQLQYSYLIIIHPWCNTGVVFSPVLVYQFTCVPISVVGAREVISLEPYFHIPRSWVTATCRPMTSPGTGGVYGTEVSGYTSYCAVNTLRKALSMQIHTVLFFSSRKRINCT
jgi:hypothetical protein